jgi:predicted alpha/beta-fold hydrolase
VWGPLVRRGRVPLTRERVSTLDGDFLDLDWLPGPPAAPGPSPSAPLLLVLHGLEGSARSHYVTGLLRHARAAGWRGVTLNFRSCGGEPNLLPRLYHSGETGDLDAVVRLLVEREPDVRIGVVGVSIGGNVLLKWLGELGADTPRQVVAAVGISVPFDLARCAAELDRGFARAVYTEHFLRTMRRKIMDKARQFPGCVDVEAARRSRTFGEYDRVVTAPLHGFSDEHDYWTRSSSGPYLDRVRRPTLLISALDDPVVPAAGLPDRCTLPPDVTAEFTARGGHAGFLEGPWPWRLDSWAERRAVEFLASMVTTRQETEACR